MNILAIDTVTETSSVAVQYAGEKLQKICDDKAVHSQFILGMINELLSDMGTSLTQMDVIAVDIGPGSFTGVRVGIGVVQGLAYGVDLPVIGVESLEALAVSARESRVMPSLDARMGQVYFGLYDYTDDHADDQLVQVVPPSVANPGEVYVPADGKPIQGLGSGWDQYSQEMIGALADHDIQYQPDCFPEAQFVMQMAEIKGIERAVSPLYLQASYVRNEVAAKSSKRI